MQSSESLDLDSLKEPRIREISDAPTLIGRSVSGWPPPAYGGEQVHVEQYGRHRDINPGNLLWFDDSDNEFDRFKGTLKLADFGQAELNTLLSRTQPRDVANTLTYLPLESDLLAKVVHQSYDIWCLGCVYLELISWQLGGQALLTKFTRRRMTPDVFQNNHLTGTFFQVVRNSQTTQTEVMVRGAVTLVGKMHSRLLVGPLT